MENNNLTEWGAVMILLFLIVISDFVFPKNMILWWITTIVAAIIFIVFIIKDFFYDRVWKKNLKI